MVLNAGERCGLQNHEWKAGQCSLRAHPLVERLLRVPGSLFIPMRWKWTNGDVANDEHLELLLDHQSFEQKRDVLLACARSLHASVETKRYDVRPAFLARQRRPECRIVHIFWGRQPSLGLPCVHRPRARPPMRRGSQAVA